MTTSRYFHRFNTSKEHQINFTRYWSGLGLRTWRANYTGRQKRAIHFGFGYLSWRIA